MKKTILFLFVFLLTNISVFAETTIELLSSDNEITLEDKFEIEVRITSDFDFEGGEFKISGLDSFYRTTQKNFSQFTSINGETKHTQTVQIGFYPNQIGDFLIGPVIIGEGDEEIRSNTIKLKVSNTIIDKTINEEKKQDLISPQEENDGLKDIKNLSYSIYDFNYIFLIILLLLILLYLYNKNSKRIDQPQLLQENNITKISFKKVIITKLRKLKKESNNLQKNLFYEKLNSLFREYFNNIGVGDSMTKTFEELLPSIVNKNILALFKDSYYNEFNSLKDNEENRLKLIDNFIKEIK